MKTKAKGSRNERKAKKILETAGYYVIKSGASLSEFDLIAANKQGWRCIQVKSNRWCSPLEREQISEKLKCLPQGTIAEEWRFDDYKRQPRIKRVE